MARPFPYNFISCPCVDSPRPTPASNRLSKDLSSLSLKASDSDEDERTFDPRSRRANYSLYPPEHLLYCEDCHQIKCARCITEEIVCWYCPNCLFETPSSMVRSDGNRCARNCFNCPICTSPLTVTTLSNAENGASQSGPWILSCSYCMWTSLDIDIKFDKPTNIRAQLLSLKNGANRRPSEARASQFKSPLASFASTPTLPEEEQDEKLGSPMSFDNKPALGHDARFTALKNFYRTQIAETSSSPSDHLIGGDFGLYSSPNALSRIMSLYNTGVGMHGNNKKSKSKPPVMREALTQTEGLIIPTTGSEDHIIEKMAAEGWDGLASMEQQQFQQPSTRFVDDLLPLPVLLRTKRSKRCKACKHILVKPEVKPQSTRFRIRLIALSYLPLTSIRPLYPSPVALPINLEALEPLKPIQFLLTLKNHMFDPIRVTLATPSVTPGPVSTKVTILCPQLEVGANTDVWDEALQSGNMPDPRSSRHGGAERVAEAGKVWDKGRNWTTVAMEVVPGTIKNKNKQAQQDMDDEDQDIVEIPVFVRIEWEADGGNEELGFRSENTKKSESDTVKRELAYWMTLGIGRIKSDAS
ncbi:dynactin Arp1 p62 subunit RO2 [Trichophyton equinum CBS 127.97]|uniref:Dynactin subunit 4 n=1 Tax=Trichophyton equinum (strain ATCC MYA-4606 / CBS 127.97) TaxID=559882 RepID=F2PKE0_TRIEC|nr:dynactin Arp1 p62 subunit RO2 [Trichophyton equinum CBS 127.97]